MRAIVPVHELQQRMPEQGRVRMGVQVATGKVGRDGKPVKRPTKLKRFRFTSADKAALDVIAEKYGGEVTPWPEAPTDNQWQVTVTEARIPIILPPDPLAGSPIYEAWSGGGCVRRCDGLQCTLAKAKDARPDAEPAVVDCPCRVENMMICKPTTRLNVVLREVPFAGSWRLESHGWNAASELPGMVAMVKAVQDSGLAAGYLEIQERQAEQGAKKFIVPAVGVPESVEAIAAGQVKLAALGKVAELRETLKEIEPPAPKAVRPLDGDWYDKEGGDDDVAAVAAGVSDVGVGAADVGDEPRIDDAEIVDEPPAKTRKTLSPRLKALHAGIADVVLLPEVDVDVDTFRHALVRAISKGRTGSSKELDDDGLRVALDVVADLLSGHRTFLGIGDDGRVRVTKRTE